LWSGARLRGRSLEPSTIVGLVAMIAVAIGFVQNIMAALPSASGVATSILRPSMMTLPTLVVAPMKSNSYVLALIACGCWTNLRSPTSTPGLAAIKVTLIAGIPVMAAAVLMLTDTVTFYSTGHTVLSPWSVLVSPLFELPSSFLWGTVGGHLGRHLARQRRLA
jgi:hypothetical protein